MEKVSTKIDFTKPLASSAKDYADKFKNENRLLEVNYEDIFSPGTLASLKGKSGVSLRQMLGDRNLRQTMMESAKLLQEIVKAEANYRDLLEQIAVEMVSQAYPIIDYADIKIEAKIDPQPAGMQQPPPQQDPASPNFGEGDPEKMKAKRRIINGITQGASIRGAFGFLIFREYLDQIDPELIEKYSQILKLVFGTYDDENAIAMMLAMLAQGTKFDGGNESEMEYDEETGQFVIKASAACFPMLVHEIIKGLYEIVGTEGFGTDKEQNQAIVGAVDKLEHEPEDLRYGKFIYDALSNIYIDSEANDPRVREFFFTKIYKLEDDEFFSFIENAVNETLTPAQKRWVKDTIRDIEIDLRRGDAGMDDEEETRNDDDEDLDNINLDDLF